MASSTLQPTFVLVRPQMGENIGAAARGMLNFGLESMRVVTPRDGWPNPKAVAMASGAGRVLDAAEQYCSVTDACGEGHFVFATTARSRGLTKEVFTPQAAMEKAAGEIARGQKVTVLFGPERSGLENEDIAIANAIISVPVNPDFPSLNLAQCVLLMSYEWRRAQGKTEDHGVEMAGAERAEMQDVQKLAEHFEQKLAAAGFFFPETKAHGMKINLRNMWSRLPLTRSDIQIFHGMLRQIVRWKDTSK